MRVTVWFIIILSLFTLPQPSTWAKETELPKNWPWRGIVMHSCCGNVEKEDIALLAKLNVNAILLNLNVRFQAKVKRMPPETAWAQSLLWADRMLDACKEHGIVGNIRLNGMPIDPRLGLTERSPSFWDNQERLQEALNLAGKLAQHFQARGSELGAYVILSEPVVQINEKPIRPAIWPRVQQQIISEIRKYDKERYIVVTPGPGGLPSNYNEFRPLQAEKIIYGAHMYVPHAYTHQGINNRPSGYVYPGVIKFRMWNKNRLKKLLAPLKDFQIKHNLLVRIGEFSAVNGAQGAEQYLADLITLFDEYQWSWTYFSYKGTPFWDPSNDKGYQKKSTEYIGNLQTKRWEILKKAYRSKRLQ